MRPLTNYAVNPDAKFIHARYQCRCEYVAKVSRDTSAEQIDEILANVRRLQCPRCDKRKSAPAQDAATWNGE